MGDETKEPNLTDGEIPSEPPKKEDVKEKVPEVVPPKKRSRKWFWIGLFVLIILTLLVVYHFRSKEAAEKKKAAAVKPQGASITVGQAKTGDINIYVDALGTVTPLNTVTVYSQITGRVMAVHYSEGQAVKKGDPLVDIDPQPYEATLVQAQGNLEHDEGVLAQAKIDLDRYQQAYSRNAIAKQQLDDQEQTVKQDEGTVKQDEGTVASAATNVDYTRITAPIDGRVGLRLVDPGNIVTSGSTTPLVVITQLQPITVIFSVAEDYLPQIQKQLRGGQKLPVDAFARDQSTKLASGSLLTLDNQIDQTTGTVKLKAIFDNHDPEPFPNQFVNARLLVDTQRGVTLLPTAAIQRNAQGTFIYVISSDNTANLRNVTVGTTDATTAAVQGVNSGEVVAVNGFDKLQNGGKVTINNKNASGGNNGNNGNNGTSTNSSTANGNGANKNGNTPASPN